ncbi:hypothetical protein WKV44_10455 [Spirochaetia bacterium 38H-sp]|uniref:RHS repeat-associated core domain-containing protein n=1 Tax=Rarispira pelagica TaxID=3141764 RepID=A0ABU9UE59_9SPIR
MGGVYNLVNLQLYHYAGNNPVKYTDPDGRVPFLVAGIVAAASLIFTSCSQPPPSQQIDEVIDKLKNANYGRVPIIQDPHSPIYLPIVIKIPRKLLDYVLLVSAALPRDPDFTDMDYTGAQGVVSSSAAAKAGNIQGAIGFLGTIVDNLTDDQGRLVGSMFLTIEKNPWTGDILWWELEYIMPVSIQGKQSRILTREQALKFLESNKELFGDTTVAEPVRDSIFKEFFQELK